MKLIVTKAFDRAVKQLKKKHDKKLTDLLADKITQIYNQTLTQGDHPHGLKGAHTNGLKDVHVSGDLIILYRYDVDSDTLIMSAKLHDIAKHKELTKDTFRERQGYERDFEEYIKEIKSSIDVGPGLDYEEVDDWFTYYYNNRIAPVLPIDDISIVSIKDRHYQLIIKAEGYQYKDTCPEYQLLGTIGDLKHLCSTDGISFSATPHFGEMDRYGDPDSYKITVYLSVPVEVEEEN